MSTCMVVMYHYVRDSEATPFPGIRALCLQQFEQQLDWLQREYDVIDIERLEAALDGGAPLPPDAALLTFDDGFIDHHRTVFPILRARGLTGVFFLTQDTIGLQSRVAGVHKTHFLLAALGPAEFGRAVLQECDPTLAVTREATRTRVFGIDHWEHADERAVKDLLNYELPIEIANRVLDALFVRHVGPEQAFGRTLYLDERMIAEMARGGMAFGHHTRSHHMLSRLSVEDQDAQLRGGVEWIRTLTGQARVPFCYPWGGPRTYTADTVRLLASSGYSLAFNTVRRRAAIGRDARFELPRLDTRDLPPHTQGEPDAVAAAPGPDA